MLAKNIVQNTMEAIAVTECGVTIDDTVLLPQTSLKLPQGVTCAIRGGNGSGKTTLLRVVAGELGNTTGSVKILGEAPRPRMPHFRRNVCNGLIGAPLAGDLTAEENLQLVSLSWFGTIDWKGTPRGELAEKFAVERFARRFPHEISSGQKQLLSLSMNVLRPMKLLLLDEPEQRLDTDHQKALANAIKMIGQQGISVIYSTHSPLLSMAADFRIMIGDTNSFSELPSDGE